jgi:Holliday junction resolvasome RuvABC endonuclease subunit
MYNNKTLILGIDSSKRSTGVCLLTHTKVDDKDVFEVVSKCVLKTKAFKDEPVFKSELDSYNMMKHFIADYVSEIDYGVLEGFAFGGQGLTKLAATAAVYQLLLAQNNKLILHIAPNRVKMIVGGSGKATKEEVRAGLKDFLVDFDKITWPTYDVSDAAAIAVASAIVNLYPERFEKKCVKKRLPKQLTKS